MVMLRSFYFFHVPAAQKVAPCEKSKNAINRHSERSRTRKGERNRVRNLIKLRKENKKNRLTQTVKRFFVINFIFFYQISLSW